MKNYIKLLVVVFVNSPLYAGLIVHNDYTSGATITASGQNSNENTIVNEFNGNIDNTNIKTGGIIGTNIANGTITGTQIAASTVAISNLNSVVISTFTSLQNLFSYRKPVLKWVSTTQVTVETGIDGNSGEAAIIYPSGILATETNNTSLTMDITRNSGTSQGGLHTGSAAANTWYALYAVRAPNIVLVADTTLPIQASSTTLDTSYGHNNWVYLGMIRYGDNSGSTTNILAFVQTGNLTSFDQVTLGNAINSSGIRLATTASATSLTYTYAAGSGAAQIPSIITHAYYGGFSNGITSGNSTSILAGAGNTTYMQGSGYPIFGGAVLRPASDGLKITNSGGVSSAMDVDLLSFYDGVLGSGSNPLL